MPGRFSLYCLSDGDEYLGDVAVRYVPCLADRKGAPATPSNLARVAGLEAGSSAYVQAFQGSLGEPIEGWLRLSGRSLFFEPSSDALPIVSFPLANVTLNRGDSNEEPAMGIKTNKLTLQLAHGKHHVHVPDHVAGAAIDHRFVGVGSNPLPRTFVSRVMVMVDANASGVAQRAQALHAIQEGCESAVPFSLSWLASALESVVTQMPVHRIAPLTQERGRLVLTTKALYFQPTFALSSVPFVRVPIADIQRLANRRVDFVDRAIEFAVREHSLGHRRHDKGASSAAPFSADSLFFFRFATAQERNAFVTSLRRTAEVLKPVPHAVLANFGDRLPARIDAMCEAWRDGKVSNFDYLMFLNWCAGRSLADLSQYPVLPWVVSDFASSTLEPENTEAFRDLSKPMGALNADRLKGFECRAEELRSMGEEPYLYGSHYSNPAYVTFWLLRSRPEYMLVLHSGKFDHASRIFDSVPGAWTSATTGPTDVKELPPQFYFGDGGFLTTHGSTLAFRDIGLRADGSRPNEDVELPRWAENPSAFIARHRAALESEAVSCRLHLWIDLIFGCAQTGEEAWRRKNVFHPLSYETARATLDKQESEEARTAMAAHIREFGQAPAQLFWDAHPPRRCGATPPRSINHDSFLSSAEASISEAVATTSSETAAVSSCASPAVQGTDSASPDSASFANRSPTPTTPAAPALAAPTAEVRPAAESTRSLPAEVVKSADPFARWVDLAQGQPQWHRRIEPMLVAQGSAIRCLDFVANDPSATPRLVVADTLGKLALVTVDSLERKPTPIATPGTLGSVVSVVSSRTAPGLATAVGKNGQIAAVEFDKAAAGDAVRAAQAAAEVTGSVIRFAVPWFPPDAAGGVDFLVGARDGILRLVPTSKTTAAVLPAVKKKLPFLPGRSDGPRLQWDLESALVAACVSPDARCAVALNEEGGLFGVGFVDAEAEDGPPQIVPAGPGAVAPAFCKGGDTECCELPEDAAKGADDVLGIWFVGPSAVAVVSLTGRLSVVSTAYENFGELLAASNIAAAVAEAQNITCVAPVYCPGQAQEDGGLPRAFAVGTRGGTIAFVDVRSGKLRAGGVIHLPTGADVTALTVSGRRVAAGDALGNVHVYVATFA